MTSLQGKKIWLIGASEGIGEALAKELAARGATLALSARQTDKINAVAAALPGGALAITVDVCDRESVASAWRQVLSAWGKADIVIYNAGAYDPLSAREFDLAKIERMVDVNFSGALRVLGAILPPFLSQSSGHIVLVASVAAYSGLPNAMGYGASKAALLHLAENLRLDLSPRNIKVQVVSPGFVKTRLTAKNTFPMPFIVTPEVAAQRIADGMETDRFEIHFPRRFTFLLKALRLLPYRLYFALARHAA